MKIVLFGRTGLVGSALFEVISKERPQWQIISPNKEECNVTDENSVRSYLDQAKPELIINATGYTAADKAESESGAAFLLNEKAVSYMATWAGAHNATIVHFSTDYVFEGTKKEGYNESDTPSPISVYGRSKAAGEEALQNGAKQFFLIRTSWLFGPNGKNFVDTILEKATRHEELKIVNDQWGSPTYTMDLAKAVLPLLESQNYGIYHIVNQGSTSWYDLAKTIFEQLGVPYSVTPITSAELQTAAKRPAYSVLNNTRSTKLRTWQQALEDYLQSKTLIL